MMSEGRLIWGMTACQLRELGVPISESVPADAGLKDISRRSTSTVSDMKGSWISKLTFELNGQEHKCHIEDKDMPVIDGLRVQ